MSEGQVLLLAAKPTPKCAQHLSMSWYLSLLAHAPSIPPSFLHTLPFVPPSLPPSFFLPSCTTPPAFPSLYLPFSLCHFGSPIVLSLFLACALSVVLALAIALALALKSQPPIASIMSHLSDLCRSPFVSFCPPPQCICTELYLVATNTNALTPFQIVVLFIITRKNLGLLFARKRALPLPSLPH